MMLTTPTKLVTIIGEAVLEDRLVRLVLKEGASGYTLSTCSGQGSRGLRSTTPIGAQNVRIEVVAGPEVADRVLRRLEAEFFPHYAVVAWLTDAAVIRGAKFGEHQG